MKELGLALVGGGIVSTFYGWVGRRLRRMWPELDPGNRQLSTVEYVQAIRQRAMIRQGPFFWWLGVVCIVTGVISFLVGWIIG